MGGPDSVVLRHARRRRCTRVTGSRCRDGGLTAEQRENTFVQSILPRAPDAGGPDFRLWIRGSAGDEPGLVRAAQRFAAERRTQTRSASTLGLTELRLPVLLRSCPYPTTALRFLLRDETVC